MLSDNEMNKWNDMYEESFDFQNFEKEMFNSFKLREIDFDNYEILLGSTVVVKLNHCYYVSKDFIEDVFENQREFFLQEEWQGVKEINMQELLNQAIQENWWDWRKEVAVYKGEVEKRNKLENFGEL